MQVILRRQLHQRRSEQCAQVLRAHHILVRPVGYVYQVIQNEQNYRLVRLGQLAERVAQLLGAELGTRQLDGLHEPFVEVGREERLGQLSQIELEQIGGQVRTLLAHFAQRQMRILPVELFHLVHFADDG